VHLWCDNPNCFGFLIIDSFVGWKELLSHMSPYSWANWGIAIGLGFSVVGAAW
jgi:hypothetical protein